MAKNSSWPITGFWSRGPLKDLKDSKLILNESKLFQWSSRISLVPFRAFRRPLLLKPVTGQELHFAVSYSKPALAGSILCSRYVSKYLRFRWCSTWYDTQDDDSIALRGNHHMRKHVLVGGLVCWLTQFVCFLDELKDGWGRVPM